MTDLPAERGWPPRTQTRSVVSPLLTRAPSNLRLDAVTEDEAGRRAVLIEADLTYRDGVGAALEAIGRLYAGLVPDDGRPPPVPVAGSYLRCLLDVDEIAALVDADAGAPRPPGTAVFHVWPDYRLEAQLDSSVVTVKSDAALRAYAAGGAGITWAVADSGIDVHHPHFASYETLGDPDLLHHDFTDLVTPTPKDWQPAPLVDELGHGTHVAGIIAGRLPEGSEERAVLATRYRDERGVPTLRRRTLSLGTTLAGVAPQAGLVSLKVLDAQGRSSASALLAALHYVRTVVNAGGHLLRIHGVNLSLGHHFDPAEYACGQSPLCREVNLLVQTGVVVVAAAGNNGYGSDVVLGADASRPFGTSASVTDPGNADRAITVGSTHRDKPHLYGITYTSSHGPTSDGRLKPDLVAPGERITSCAAGAARRRLEDLARDEAPDVPAYVEDSGTSMAAPHVSGVIAAFLSVRREFVGRPDEVKQLFCDTATSLGRERYYEGHGMVDLMRALGSV